MRDGDEVGAYLDRQRYLIRSSVTGQLPSRTVRRECSGTVIALIACSPLGPIAQRFISNKGGLSDRHAVTLGSALRDLPALQRRQPAMVHQAAGIYCFIFSFFFSFVMPRCALFTLLYVLNESTSVRRPPKAGFFQSSFTRAHPGCGSFTLGPFRVPLDWLKAVAFAVGVATPFSVGFRVPRRALLCAAPFSFYAVFIAERIFLFLYHFSFFLKFLCVFAVRSFSIHLLHSSHVEGAARHSGKEMSQGEARFIFA